MRLNLGLVKYINALPITAAIQSGAVEVAADILYGVPTALNSALRNGDLDLSLVSSVEYLQNRDQYSLLPTLCIAAEGRAGSVCLFSEVAPEDLSGATIGVTAQSATSVALLQVLCRHHWNVEVTCVVIDGAEEAKNYDAYLLIGDDCLRHCPEQATTITDLGEAWKAATGLPFCFAVLAATKKAAERDPDAVAAVEEALATSLQWGLQHPEKVVEAAKNAIDLSTEELREYYQLLTYTFDEAVGKGLETFAQQLDTSAVCKQS